MNGYARLSSALKPKRVKQGKASPLPFALISLATLTLSVTPSQKATAQEQEQSAEVVSLFYVADVEQILFALKPNAMSSVFNAEQATALVEAKKQLQVAEDALTEAQSSVNTTQSKIAELKITLATLKPEQDQAQIEAAKQKQTDLTNQLATQQQALSENQQKTQKVRLSLIELLKIESTLAASQHAAYYKADSEPMAKNALERVALYGYPEQRTIFIRGASKDIEVVKEMIARFDRPVPQARLTLWTLELNSTGNSGQRRLNEARLIVDQEVAKTRGQLANVLNVLRDCVNVKVNEVALGIPGKTASVEPPIRVPISEKATIQVTSEQQKRLQRYHFYADEVLERFGIEIRRDQTQIKKIFHDDPSYILNNVPDPGNTTTVGEALMILSLAKSKYRREILDEFEKRVATILPQDKKSSRESQQQSFYFPQLRAYFHLEREDHEGITPEQFELIHALQSSATQRLFDQALQLSEIYVTRQHQQNGVIRLDIKSQLNSVLKRVINLSGLSTEFTILKTTKTPADTKLALDQFLEQNGYELKNFVRQVQNLYPRAANNARIAAADQMLKTIIIALEDDLDRDIIQPMLRALTSKRLNGVIEVGGLQRVSILTSNRLQSRLDPRASAQLDPIKQLDLLDDAVKLSEGLATPLTGKPLFNNPLFSKPQLETAPKLYNVNSGDSFQVSPIIDPSGQALRFRLEYLATNRIKEPDGSIDRQLPRIESNRMITEMQLSSMEVREIARFDANVQVGIPTHYTGGVPVLRDIPLLREIPLIGWFSKRGGKAAVSQHSIIIGQSIIYPTIGDITALLSVPDPIIVPTPPMAPNP